MAGHAITAQTVRKYSNEFLNIGVDAAAFGMANAVTATSKDVNAGYWNPAGLVHLEDYEFSLMHASYFANIALYDYLAGAMPLDNNSAVGLSVIRFGVDDILDTRALIDAGGNITPFDQLPRFSTADWAFTLSYARKLPLDGFSFGVNAKVIRRVIGDFASAWGFGFDAGVQFDRGKWNIGVMARDITTTVNTWSIDDDIFDDIGDSNNDGVVDENDEATQQEVPESTEITIPKLQVGIARTFVYRYDFTFQTALDLNVRFAETNDIISTSTVSMTPALGFQAGYIDMIFLRAGLGNFQEELQLDGSDDISFQPGFGVGFKYAGIQVDYAFTDIGDQSAALYSNVFSLKLDWSAFRK
ncbi:PorV/PorQ family protein [Gangjinia marincola]|uniref:PorV/PorQ family protein n=1 Tax=Gangjinia marincola TaxID=578463 RepID=A0ABN1MDL9_9FLAO